MEDSSRRRFLVHSATGLGTAWMLANWPGVLSAHEHAHRTGASTPAVFEFFSAAQAAEVEAIAAQIIPSDDGPGAREAHVVYFVDRALTSFDHLQQAAYTQGLKDLHDKVGQLFPGKESFASLSNDQQIRMLTAIENTDFFEHVRVHTIMGFLSDPSYGGNFDEIGWKLIGFKNLGVNQYPFGYYDGDEAAKAAKTAKEKS